MGEENTEDRPPIRIALYSLYREYPVIKLQKIRKVATTILSSSVVVGYKTKRAGSLVWHPKPTPNPNQDKLLLPPDCQQNEGG